jgi:putative PIN family toxin of toxin-antitoxin system
LIVVDASTLVGAALKVNSLPEQAFFQARREDKIALSIPVEAEIASVMLRPKLARLISAERRSQILVLLRRRAVWFTPETAVSECRDEKDNKYLELALEAEAGIIVSSDNDLTVLNPWRGIRILRPAEYLNQYASLRRKRP